MERELRYKPCGSTDCCYTNDVEYVTRLEKLVSEIDPDAPYVLIEDRLMINHFRTKYKQ